MELSEYAGLLNKFDRHGLKENNELLEEIINSIPVGICIYHKVDGTITRDIVNDTICRIKGVSRQQLLSEDYETLFQRVHPEDLELVREETLRAFEQEKTTLIYRTKNAETGAYMWINRMSHTVQNDDGSMTAYLCYFDITDQIEHKNVALYRQQQEKVVQLQEDIRKAHEILDSISCGIVVLYMSSWETGRINYLNRRMYELLKFDRIDIRRRRSERIRKNQQEDIYAFIHPDDRERVREHFRKHFEEEHFTVENFRIHVGEGLYSWVTADVSLHRKEDETKIFYTTFRDVTQEMRLQKELTDRLSREQELKQEAIVANSLKSDFLSNVSHDMRTPLNGVLGYTNLAMQSRDMETVQGYLSKIRKSGDILMQLINDTLDLNKIETGEVILKRQAVLGSEMLQRMLTAIRPSMDEKQMRFTVQTDTDDFCIYADPVRVQEIFINLLSNAMKFTARGGKVDFVIHSSRTQENILQTECIIRDNGVGISEEFLPKIFEPFSQERTGKTSDVGGSGLGLAIVKRLVVLMDGEISVKSVVGKGTEFVIRLPFEIAPLMAGAAMQRKRPISCEDLDNLQVLLCEDNAMNTEIAKKILERHGAVVSCAGNGLEGCKMFAAQAEGKFDVILMDIRMPVMNGYEAARTIRGMKRPDASKVPIIALTADAYADDVQRSIEAGMNAHLSKPIDPRAICETIAQCVKKTEES